MVESTARSTNEKNRAVIEKFAADSVGRRGRQ
jgi:hypothetical protein